MIFDRNYDSMQQRARMRPDSTEAIAVIAGKDELRRRAEERQIARRARIKSLFSRRDRH